jgi:hypothetical protein
VYAGTYQGIYRWTNNDRWRLAGLAKTGVLSLAVNSKGYIFAGTERGVYISTGDGQVWRKATLPDYWISSIAINSKGHIFAAASGRNGGGGVFRSVDNGRMWTKVFSLGRETTTFAMAITQSDEVLVGAANCCPVYEVSLFRSGNNRKDWEKLLNFKYPNELGIGAIAFSSNGSIFVGTTIVGD